MTPRKEKALAKINQQFLDISDNLAEYEVALFPAYVTVGRLISAYESAIVFTNKPVKTLEQTPMNKIMQEIDNVDERTDAESYHDSGLFPASVGMFTHLNVKGVAHGAMTFCTVNNVFNLDRSILNTTELQMVVVHHRDQPLLDFLQANVEVAVYINARSLMYRMHNRLRTATIANIERVSHEYTVLTHNINKADGLPDYYLPTLMICLLARALNNSKAGSHLQQNNWQLDVPLELGLVNPYSLYDDDAESKLNNDAYLKLTEELNRQYYKLLVGDEELRPQFTARNLIRMRRVMKDNNGRSFLFTLLRRSNSLNVDVRIREVDANLEVSVLKTQATLATAKNQQKASARSLSLLMDFTPYYDYAYGDYYDDEDADYDEDDFADEDETEDIDNVSFGDYMRSLRKVAGEPVGKPVEKGETPATADNDFSKEAHVSLYETNMYFNDFGFIVEDTLNAVLPFFEVGNDRNQLGIDFNQSQARNVTAMCVAMAFI